LLAVPVRPTPPSPRECAAHAVRQAPPEKPPPPAPPESPLDVAVKLLDALRDGGDLLIDDVEVIGDCAAICGEISVCITGDHLHRPALSSLAGGRRDAWCGISVGRCANNHLIVSGCYRTIADRRGVVKKAGGRSLSDRRRARAEGLRALAKSHGIGSCGSIRGNRSRIVRWAGGSVGTQGGGVCTVASRPPLRWLP
jgi:hypothetical protein